MPRKKNPNFRSGYIHKCFYTGVGTSETDGRELAKLLCKEEDIDVEQLVTFCWLYMIPQKYRLDTWKFMLGLNSCYLEFRPIMDELKRKESEMLIKNMRILGLTENPAPNLSTPIIVTKQDVVWMVLESHCRLGYWLDKEDDDYKAVYVLCDRIEEVGIKWEEVYYLSREIYKLLREAYYVINVEDLMEELCDRFLCREADPNTICRSRVNLALKSGGLTLFSTMKASHMAIDKFCTKKNVAPFIREIVKLYIQFEYSKEATLSGGGDDYECRVIKGAVEAIAIKGRNRAPSDVHRF